MNIIESNAAEAKSEAKRPSWIAGLRPYLDAAQRLEMRIVCAQRQFCDRGLLNALAAATNWLGNGWLYLFLAAALLLGASRRAHLVLVGAGLAVVAAHTVYPWIKRRIARLRPFERLPQLRPRTPVLDRYSFPSGHCMTATAVAIPLAQGYPELAGLVLAVCLLIAWARIACAHHYPSDLLAGSALGALMAYGSLTLLQTIPVL